MKDKLIERLQLMDKAIQEQHQKLQQENANLNMLNGCRQELAHIINMMEPTEPTETPPDAPQDDNAPECPSELHETECHGHSDLEPAA